MKNETTLKTKMGGKRNITKSIHKHIKTGKQQGKTKSTQTNTHTHKQKHTQI